MKITTNPTIKKSKLLIKKKVPKMNKLQNKHKTKTDMKWGKITTEQHGENRMA